MLSITKYPATGKDDDEDTPPEERRCDLVVELIGSRANLILIDDDNMILDAVRRIPPGSSQRPIMPREIYTLPPAPGDRLDPRTATANGVSVALARSGKATKDLPAAYAGVSPQLAREAVARAALGGETGEAAPDAIAAELRRLYTDPWAPSIAYEEDHPIAFAPYHMAQYDDVRRVETISRAITIFFEAGERVTGHAQRRERLANQITDLLDRSRRQHEALDRELSRAAAIDSLRWEGEMIYGYLHTLVPGQSSLEVEGKVIRLDPSKTPVENAKARFREYDKAKGALAGVPERLASTEQHLAYLEETLALLELADSFEAILTIERELLEQGLLARRSSQPKGPRSGPLRLRSSEGVPILVGRSAGQNELVTFEYAQNEDLWLHARGVPGAHVVVRADGPVGDATLLEAAGLAAYFSKARNSTSTEVSLCRRRDVRKVPGGPPGLVTIRNERSIRVSPLAPDRVGAGIAVDPET
jgi:predicted ribosome quality control (RQC) complex YloA/Tae2 family protein